MSTRLRKNDNTYTTANQLESAKVYRASITQTGTNNPVATVFENTLGGTVVLTRSQEGAYSATLAGVFTPAKTFLLAMPDNATGVAYCCAACYVPDVIEIVSFNNNGNLTDLGGGKLFLEIRIYP